MQISFDLEIYTYQIDFAHHVSNITYIQWMEIGRSKLLEAVGLPVPQIAQQGFLPVLVHTEIFYKQPLYLGDRVGLNLWLSELRGASARIEFRFYNGEEILVAMGNQKGLFVDPNTQRPRRLEPHQRKLFEPYLHAHNEDK